LEALHNGVIVCRISLNCLRVSSRNTSSKAPAMIANSLNTRLDCFATSTKN
jgi:hypothetical protein